MSKKILGLVQMTRWALKCERCSRAWETLTHGLELPTICPTCKSRYWQHPRGTLKRGPRPK